MAAYASLMTDAYPPFRLDLGERDPGSAVALPRTAPPALTGTVRPFTPGRIAAVVGGAVLGLLALALVVAGGTGIVLDRTQRDGDGFLMTPTETFTTATYALSSRDVEIDGGDGVARGLLGTVRIRASSVRPVFVGIAPAPLAEAYLARVEHAVVTDLGRSDTANAIEGGVAPTTLPADSSIWAASSVGSGEQTLQWEVGTGHWSVVAMNADGSPGVTVDLSLPAEVDALLLVAIGVLALGLVLGALAGGLVSGGLRGR